MKKPATYHILKQAEDDNELEKLIDERAWASVINSFGPEIGEENSFVLAQKFLRQMLERKEGAYVAVPIIDSFNELVN